MAPSGRDIVKLMWSNRLPVLSALFVVCRVAAADGGAASGTTVISGSVTESKDTVVAGADGATFRTRAGYDLYLGPRTAIKFERPTKLQLAASAQTPTQVVELRSGRIEVRSPKTTPGPQALMVATPSKVMGVVTTGDGIVLASEQGVTVASPRGGILVGVGNVWRPLPGGFARTISKEDRAGKMRPIPSAPVVRLPSTLIASVAGGGRSVSTNWEPVTDAARYEVMLTGKKGERRITTDQPAAEFATLEPGAYAMTVRAVDRHGLSGAESPPKQLRVLNVVLPPGAYAGADGAIRLDPDGRVTLVGAEGLTMTLGNSGEFVPLPESLGLNRGAASDVRLRDPATAAEMTLSLVPKLGHASIKFDPVRPRWPNQPMTLQIELFDGRGKPTSRDVKAALEVRVNQFKLSPAWQKNGHVLSAKLLPPSPLGPWVLKVKVSRPSGEVVGGSTLRIGEH